MSDIRKTVWQQFTDARLSSDLTCVCGRQVYGVECMELGKLYISIRNTTYYAVQLCFCYCMSCALEGRRQIWGRHLDSSSQGWLIKMYCVHVCCVYTAGNACCTEGKHLTWQSTSQHILCVFVFMLEGRHLYSSSQGWLATTGKGRILFNCAFAPSGF